MSSGTLYDKVWDRHRVTTLPNGQDQLFVGLHLIHEVTSPQAFGMLRERDIEVARPDLTLATVDHIVPTADQSRPYSDDAAENMMSELEENVRDAGIEFLDPPSGEQGIVHVVGPEQGITQPGKTIVCGDSHTSTHGAFGALAFGIGTSQIRDVLATQTIAMEKQKVRKIQVDGELGEGVEAKDIILRSSAASAPRAASATSTSTLARPSRIWIWRAGCPSATCPSRGGARAGYVNPDETTYEWMKETDYFQEHPEKFDELTPYWESIRSDEDAEYDDVVHIDASELDPVVTWGTTLGQGIGIHDPIPAPEDLPEGQAGHRPTRPEAHARRPRSEHGRIRHRRRLPRFLYERPPARPAPRGAHRRGPRGPRRRPRAGRPRQPARPETGRGRRPQGRLRGGRLRLAQRRLFDVSRHERGPFRRATRRVPPRRTATSSAARGKDGRTVLMNPRMVAAAAITGEVSDVRDLEEAEVTAR